jgi:hypothetical protein
MPRKSASLDPAEDAVLEEQLEEIVADEPAVEPEAYAPEPDPADLRTPDPVAPPSSAVRVETFSSGDGWGYRTVDVEGNVVFESGLGSGSQAEALKEAKKDPVTEDLYLVDAEPPAPSRFAW